MAKNLCECGREISYTTSKKNRSRNTKDGHHLCRQCWKKERDRSRLFEEAKVNETDMDW